MDHYNAERWILDRHAAMIEAAERRARLRPDAAGAFRPWLASWLRILADKLDAPCHLERTRKLTTKQLS